MAQNMHTAGRRTLNKSVRDGTTFMGQARNTVTDPTLNVHPAKFYVDRFGTPDSIDPNNLDDLPRNTETIASTFQDSTPDVIANYIVDASLYSQSYEHFVILPPQERDDARGVTSNVLRFNSAPFDIAPEGSSGSVIRHEMERTTMTLDRYGQSMEMMDDFANTPEGEEMYEMYLETMRNDLILSGQIAVMTALLRCYDNKRAYVQRFGGGMTSHGGLDSHTSMFGVMYKNDKAFYKLSDYAKTMGMTQNAAPFTHVFLTYPTRTQAALGSEYENEFYRRGPKSSVYLEGGTAAVTQMPGTGLRIITEPDYNNLDGTEMRPGEKLQLLENDVSVGRYNVICFDKQIVNEEYPIPNRDMNLGYLNWDLGDGQIQIQDYTRLLRALLCWQANGELRRSAYDNMISGGYAERLAKDLGIADLTNRARPNEGALIDPFIVDGPGGIRATVRYVGNMHSAYMDREAAQRIAGSALNAVKREMHDRDFAAMEDALAFLEDNYNVDPYDDDNLAFIKSCCTAPDPSDKKEFVTKGKNTYGCYNVPPPSKTRANYPSRGYFPGFSSMQHLRTVRDFAGTGNFSLWMAQIKIKEGTEGAQTFDTTIRKAVAGLYALEKFAKICKSIWCNKRAPNAFFTEDALPFWMRGANRAENSMDAFLQNIVVGLRYPMAVNEDLSNAPAETRARGPAMNYLETKVISGAYATRVIDEQFGLSAMFPAGAITAAKRNDMIGNIVREGIWEQYETAIIDNPEEFRLQNFENNDLLPGGWESVLAAMKEVFPVNTNANTFRTDEEKLRFAEVWGLVITLLHRRLNANATEQREGGSPQVYDAEQLKAIVQLAKMTRRKEYANGGKRRFVRTEDAEAHESSLASRRLNVNARSNTDDSEYVNSTLSFNPKFISNWFSDPSTADRLSGISPTDVTAPGILWMTDSAFTTLGDTGRTAAEIALARDYMAKASRSKFDIDLTRMGSFASSAFVTPLAQPSAKRVRREDGGQSSGARYVSMGGPRARFPDDMDAGVRSTILNQARGIDDEVETEIWSEYNRGHDGLMVGTQSSIVQEANLFFQQRWMRAVERHGENLPLLAQHLLLLGQRVHRDSFIQMADMGVPAPVAILTVDPMINLTMSHAVFVSANCGNLYYAFKDMSNGYDPNHKKLTAYMTIWMKGFVRIPQHVFIAENISFAGYNGGGDGSLIQSISTEEDMEDEHEGEYDYDPLTPDQRRANRFVLHLGISTKLSDIPNPLPLNGSFGGQGAMTGMGRYVNEENVYVDRNSALYDSALIVNEIAKFYRLNPRGADVMGIDDYFQRTSAIRQTKNLVCFQADQFGFNKSTGDHKLRKLTGTGHLGKCCEGITPQLNGEPGLFSTQLAITGQ